MGSRPPGNYPGCKTTKRLASSDKKISASGAQRSQNLAAQPPQGEKNRPVLRLRDEYTSARVAQDLLKMGFSQVWGLGGWLGNGTRQDIPPSPSEN